MAFKRGDTLKCISSLGTGQLTDGREYIAATTEQEGIFASRPFVSVIGDNGDEYHYHASRFALVDSLCDLCGAVVPNAFHCICDKCEKECNQCTEEYKL